MLLRTPLTSPRASHCQGLLTRRTRASAIRSVLQPHSWYSSSKTPSQTWLRVRDDSASSRPMRRLAGPRASLDASSAASLRHGRGLSTGLTGFIIFPQPAPCDDYPSLYCPPTCLATRLCMSRLTPQLQLTALPSLLRYYYYYGGQGAAEQACVTTLLQSGVSAALVYTVKQTHRNHHT